MANLPRVIYGAATNYADVTAPTLVSAEVQVNGTDFEIVFSETVTIGAGGNGGFTIDTSGAPVTLTYAGGSGSDTLTYTLSRTILTSETFSAFDYVQPVNGVEDLAGNDLATFTAQHGEVVNSSGEAGVSYEFTETFEGSNTDTQSIAGYDNTGWTSSNVANNPRYTTSPAPLAETYSLYLPSGARYIERTITGYGATACMYGIYRSVTFTLEYLVVRFLTAAGTELACLRTRTNYTTGIRIECSPSVGLSTSAFFDVSGDIHIWFEYTKGTGANAVCRLYLSANATKPGTATTTFTAGTATGDAAKIKLSAASIGIWDHIVCDPDPIGSDPV